LRKASYELRLFEEARDNPERQLRILTREFVFELLEIDGSNAQLGRMNTLETMLTEKGADIVDIKTKAAAGQPVALTPETVQATKPLVLGPKRSREPSHVPAAPAGFQTYNIFGTGDVTPRPGDISPRGAPEPTADAELEKIRRQFLERTGQLQDTELELAAHRLASGMPSGMQSPRAGLADVMLN